MNCNNCRAQWVPPAGVNVTTCPFCMTPLAQKPSINNSTPGEIISTVIIEFGFKVLQDKDKLARIIAGITVINAKTKSLLILAIRANVCEELYDLIINKNTQTDLKSIVTYFAVGNSLSLSDAQTAVDVFESACSVAMSAEKKDEQKITLPEKEMISEPSTPEQPDKQATTISDEAIHENRQKQKQQERQIVTTIPDSDASSSRNHQPAVTEQHKRIGSIRVKPGDTINFGHYEQDTTGSKAPIVWRVLTVENGKALLLSEKILDSKPYSRVLKNGTWETCTLRAWLNNGFYNLAFSADEKSRIQTTRVGNDDKPEAVTTGGNDTDDKVFLLSYNESISSKYGFSSDRSKFDTARWARGTEYAKKNGLWVSENSEFLGNSYWWLRSSKTTQHKIGVVFFFGAINILPDDTQNGTNIGVRPAIWISLTEIEQKQGKQKASTADDIAMADKPSSVEKSAKTNIKAQQEKQNQTKHEQPEQKKPDMTSLKTGDTIHFGQYEQTMAGSKDAIAWHVLSVGNGKALLLSEMILDSKPYNTVKKDVVWETCTLRDWLNNEFFNTAFSSDEKSRIKTTRVINDGNPKLLGTDDGMDTDDKIFLLSKSESINPTFGFNPDKSKTDPTRCAKGTEFAKKNGLWVSDKGLSLGNSIWWLQTPGDDKRQGWSVYDEGNVNIGYYNEYGVSNKRIGVRPAIWINL